MVNFNFLGIYIGDKLKFDRHIKKQSPHLTAANVFTESFVYTYIFKIHICTHSVEISIPFYQLFSRNADIENNISNHRSFMAFIIILENPGTIEN